MINNLYKQAKLKEFDVMAKALFDYYKMGTPVNIESLGTTIIQEIGAPNDPIIDELILSPFVIQQYFDRFCYKENHFIDEYRVIIMSEVRKLRKMEQRYIRIRQFQSKNGYYYGFPFMTEDSYYCFWDDRPLLLTRTSKEILEEQTWGSEIASLIRPEVRMLSSLMFSVSTGLSLFNLSENVYDVPERLVLGETGSWSQDALERAKKLAFIMSRLNEQEGWDIRDATHFKFRLHDLPVTKAKIFYDKFDINDNLALRTSFLLIKAVTLWNQGRIFGEDACANLFFALEGCLRIIHRRAFESKSFETNAALRHITATFKHAPGYEGFLKEIYAKRTHIVHPEPRFDANWIPTLTADDFYEGFEMAIDLIYYGITGELLPRK